MIANVSHLSSFQLTSPPDKLCVVLKTKKVCFSNTPYLRVLKLLFNTVVAVYLKRIELFSSIPKKNLFFRYFNNFQHFYCSSCIVFSR